MHRGGTVGQAFFNGPWLAYTVWVLCVYWSWKRSVFLIYKYSIWFWFMILLNDESFQCIKSLNCKCTVCQNAAWPLTRTVQLFIQHVLLSHLLLLLPSGIRCCQNTNHRSWDSSLRTPGTHHYVDLLIIMIHTWTSLPSSLYMSLSYVHSPDGIILVYGV